MKKVRWGVLGAAKIALEKVIPAMKGSDIYEVTAIGSRSLDKAKAAASQLGIPKYYGSYEEVINDPDIDAIYNPLPNDLHVSYTLKCIQAGKHVLCEKPFALHASDIQPLILARDKMGVKVGEAFMVASNPQWIKVKEIIAGGDLGKIKAVQGFFSYFNRQEDNIRNKPENGGGGVWDIGCYPIFTSRFALGEEPQKLAALLDFDPDFGTDKLGSVILQYPSAQMTFSISTQLMPYQRMFFFGERKALEVRIPFNAPIDQPNEIHIHHGDITGHQVEVIRLEISDQYTKQADDFTRAILEDKEVPVSLESAYQNTKILEAIFQAAAESRWVDLS